MSVREVVEGRHHGRWAKGEPIVEKPMNKHSVHGLIDVPFGAEQKYLTMPIIGLPPDTIRVKRRLRNGEFARFYVQTPNGVTCYLPLFTPDKQGFVLGQCLIQGVNQRGAK